MLNIHAKKDPACIDHAVLTVPFPESLFISPSVKKVFPRLCRLNYMPIICDNSLNAVAQGTIGGDNGS